jgi:uncharacterized protein YdaU (DUF1376 family)
MVNIHTVPLNIGDFHKDIVHMEAREVGAYILLFLAHIQAGEEGLHCDDKKLARIARVSDKVWKGGLRESVMEKFRYEIHPTGNEAMTRFVSDQCIKLIRRVEYKSAVNSANALKRKGSG